MRTLFLLLLSSPGFFFQQVNAQSLGNEQPNTGDNHPDHFVSKDFFSENDGGVSAIYSVPDYQCTGVITPSVEIINYGSNVLTDVLIKYFIDAQPPSYFPWQGYLEPGEVDVIEFEAIDVVAGSHKLTVSIIEANGLADINGANNDGLVNFYVVGTSIPAPVYQEFEAIDLPQGYFIKNYDDGLGWDMYNQEIEPGTNNYMMQMHFYYNIDANPDQVYIKNIDLSNAGAAEMNFEVAYRYYKNTGDEKFDKLLVQASPNCGADWDILYEKEKDELATLPPSDIEYTQVEDSDWRTETVDLNNYLGNSNVMIRFEAISGHGNNLYIDNLKISSTVGIDNPDDSAASLKLFPNPADEQVSIDFSGHSSDNSLLMVCNAIGQQIFVSAVPNKTSFSINTAEWPGGFYFIKVFNKEKIEEVSALAVVH